MTEFERAVVLLLAAQVELLRTSAVYHASLPDEEPTSQVPDRLHDALLAATPEVAALIDAATLRGKRRRATK